MSKLKIKFVSPGESIEDAKYIRTKVFQDEQGIAKALDFDGKDDLSTHIIVYNDKTPVGTGRIEDIGDGKVKIERISVLSKMRGKGVGKELMRAIDEYISNTQTLQATLDAQFHAKGFYERLGFKQKGEVFEEVGISHIVMEKKYRY